MVFLSVFSPPGFFGGGGGNLQEVSGPFYAAIFSPIFLAERFYLACF